MEKVILALLLTVLLVVVSLSVLSKWSGGWLKFKKPYDPNTLSHDSLLDLLVKLGHSKYDGVCHGFIINWALAVAEGKEDQFYRKIHLLRTYQRDLPAILQRIEQNKTNKELASVEELHLKTLPALCRKICIAQEPLDFKKTYGKLVWQSDITAILQKIAAPLSRVRQMFYKTHTFASRQQARDYFDLLKTTAIDSNTAVIISTSDHSMGFKLAGNLWRFININDLYKQKKVNPYFEFTTSELVAELYRVSTASRFSRRLTVNTHFVASDATPHVQPSVDNVFPVFPVGPKITSHEKVSFFAMAALQGDVPTVQKCMQSGWSVFAHHEVSDDSPIVSALQLGRREVVKVMASSLQHRINHRRKKDGATLLHLACGQSSSAIVEDLLSMTGIEIDPIDNEGRTPLMVACGAELLRDDHKIFEQLLDRGASLTAKDNDGLTVLQHAKNNKHKIAVMVIESRIKSQSVSNHQLPPPVSTSFGRFFKSPSITTAFEPKGVIRGLASTT